MTQPQPNTSHSDPRDGQRHRDRRRPHRRDQPHPRAARRLRGRARRDPPARDRRARRARRRLHEARDQGPARPRGRRPGAALGRLVPARLARRHRRALALEDPRQHGDRPQRHARPVRLDERPEALEQGLRVGHGLPRRPVAPLPQLHAPHPHQHRRQGPRHRLRRPADVRGPGVAALLPRQPALRDAARDLLPVRGRAARRRGRADRRRARPR